MAARGAEAGQQLTKDLRAQVTGLEHDLLDRARDVPEFAEALKTEYDAARAAERTGVGFTEWREGRVTQAAAAGLFDRQHNPLWELTPSYEAATALIAFWRPGGSTGSHYTFDGWDTRFLGDLYQDLSESARKTYALLQTPEFEEEFILLLGRTPRPR